MLTSRKYIYIYIYISKTFNTYIHNTKRKSRYLRATFYFINPQTVRDYPVSKQNYRQ